MHIVLRDVSNVSEEACQYDVHNPRDAAGQTAEMIRASYGQPSSASPRAGVWSLKEECQQQVSRATGFPSPSPATSSSSGTSTNKGLWLFFGILIGLVVALVSLILWRRSHADDQGQASRSREIAYTKMTD
jgi:hypothetical protein